MAAAAADLEVCALEGSAALSDELDVSPERECCSDGLL